MKWYWWLLIAWTLVNLSAVMWLALAYSLHRCDWCHRRYWLWSSTSAYRQVFCSYRCNFWDMRDYIALKAELDIGDVEEMLGRRGWIHPDKVEVTR